MRIIFDIIDKILNRKYVYTRILIGKITMAFFFFGIILTILLLNENFVKSLNSYDIVTTNLVFGKVIDIICKNTLFNILLNTLGLNLTPNASQLLGMLILGYTSMIGLVILSMFFNILILPLITVSSTMFMFYLKITGNWIISSYTLIDFYGIKIIKKLTNEEKWSYLKDLYLKYENNLDEKYFIKDFNLEDNKEEILDKFKDINDIDIIKESFYKILENFTQIELTDNEIVYLINVAYEKIAENQSYKIDKSLLFDKIKENDLIGNKEIIDFINNYFNENINKFYLTDIIEWINLGMLNDHKWTILLTIIGIVGIACIGYYIWSANSIGELQEISKNQENQNIARQELEKNQAIHNQVVDDHLENLEKKINETTILEKNQTIHNQMVENHLENLEKKINETTILEKNQTIHNQMVENHIVNLGKKINETIILDKKIEWISNQMIDTAKKWEVGRKAIMGLIKELNKNHNDLEDNVEVMKEKCINLECQILDNSNRITFLAQMLAKLAEKLE